MTEFKCDKCFKTFSTTWNLKRHNERKTPCIRIDNADSRDTQKKSGENSQNSGEIKRKSGVGSRESGEGDRESSVYSDVNELENQKCISIKQTNRVNVIKPINLYIFLLKYLYEWYNILINDIIYNKTKNINILYDSK